jgi:iron complex transport system substrate-binding protein
MLFAMGAGDQVVAGDLFSNYPPEANELEKVDAFNLNLEAVIALDPDLVVLSFDPGGAVDGLSAVGIPTLQYGTPVTLDDAYEQMAALGGSVGRSAEAAELIAAVRQRIEGAIDGVGDDFAGVSYYLETDPFTFYTPNSRSFLGQIFGLLGMVNIADAAPDEFGSGFPQLSPEFIIAANPDVIFLASFGETGDTLAARDGWDTMSAVDRGAVLLLDPDVASRWGPRVAELVEAVTGGMVSLVR